MQTTTHGKGHRLATPCKKFKKEQHWETKTTKPSLLIIYKHFLISSCLFVSPENYLRCAFIFLTLYPRSYNRSSSHWCHWLDWNRKNFKNCHSMTECIHWQGHYVSGKEVRNKIKSNIVLISFKTRQISVFGIVRRRLLVLIVFLTQFHRMQQSYIRDFLDKITMCVLKYCFLFQVVFSLWCKPIVHLLRFSILRESQLL